MKPGYWARGLVKVKNAFGQSWSARLDIEARWFGLNMDKTSTVRHRPLDGMWSSEQGGENSRLQQMCHDRLVETSYVPYRC